MIEIHLPQKQISIFFLILGFTIISLSCASNNSMSTPLTKLDDETLKERWLESNNVGSRYTIIREFEKRKSMDGLLFCLYYATRQHYNTFSSSFSKKDAIETVHAIGRIKDPKAIAPLREAFHLVQDTELKLVILRAYQQIDSPGAMMAVKESLRDSDPKIRFVALEMVAQNISSETLEVVLPLLLDGDSNVRWKAVHTLGQIGDPRAAGRIGFLLSDPDNRVREITSDVLNELGVSAQKIDDWKRKSLELSIDEVYRTRMAYQKAEYEKQELAKRLESEMDLKKQLEESLKKKEIASGKQKDLVESLYEKERQLKSKQAQLDITLKQSEEFRTELEKLNAKVELLNTDLNEAKNQRSTKTVQQELSETLEARTKLEIEAKNTRERESSLREEISSLNALANDARLEAEAANNMVISLRNREKQLTSQIDELKQRLNRSVAPVLVVSKPESGAETESQSTLLHFIAVDEKGIRKIDLSINGNPVKLDRQRGINIVADQKSYPKKIDISQKLQLQSGPNIIKISVVDIDGITQAEEIRVKKVKARGDIWAIVIGINQYQHTRNLKYAVNDAQAFRDYLKDYVGVPDERVFYLADSEATKSRIESLLGTTIKRKAAKDDTVLIFYAGHGAVEPDSSNLDGDGFEKYLLPHDANLEDLYSTSISMNNVRTIFSRIRADRLIFIADTCYSGASGGRTMMATKSRANLSDKFYDRIAKGKGRVIISSCSANEISKEDDNLQHGVFSYYMLEGLKGRADQDGDDIITVSELFSYISRKVPQASAQDQHPVKKGETEGELIIGRTK